MKRIIIVLLTLVSIRKRYTRKRQIPVLLRRAHINSIFRHNNLRQLLLRHFHEREDGVAFDEFVGVFALGVEGVAQVEEADFTGYCWHGEEAVAGGVGHAFDAAGEREKSGPFAWGDQINCIKTYAFRVLLV